MKKGVGLGLILTLTRPGPNEERCGTWPDLYLEEAWSQCRKDVGPGKTLTLKWPGLNEENMWAWI